jgi:flavin-dependent thymidylate synthase
MTNKKEIKKEKPYAKLKVTLMSFTKEPMKVIFNTFMNMHNDIPAELKDVKISKKELDDFMEMFSTQPHQTCFEMVNTVWKIEGASRAFQQQLTRTRDAAYSIQSLRIVQTGKFADNKDYTKSSKTLENAKANKLYDETMKFLQDRYNELLKLGCATEDARGILPLNIHSPITMSINMRYLYHMLELRFCDNTQEEYREVARQMKEEVAKKMHPLLAKPMVPMCFRSGKCPSPFPCSKYPNIPKACKMDVSRWLKG